MILEGKLLSISRKQLGLFYILLAAVWLGESVYEFIHHNIRAGVSLLMFGSIFLIALCLIQNYFTKMLLIYQKNLNNNKHSLKNRG